MTEEPSYNKRTRNYIIFLLLILVLVDLVDQYSTNYINTIPSLVVKEFLPGYSDEEGAAIYSLCLTVASMGTYFVFLFQYLADKFGRKIMLAVSSFGLGFSSLLLALSTNIFQYTFFLFLLYIFFSSDMWLIYIGEEAPPEKRAKWTNYVLATGVLGPVLIPIFRSIFITDNSSNWRGMTLFPIFIGIPLGIIILFTLEETLKYEEIKSGKLSEELPSIVFKENVRGLFRSERKQEYNMILLMSLIVGLNYVILSVGEKYISDKSGLPQSQVNIVIYVIAFSVIFGYISTGILADKIGRKPMLNIHTAIMLVAIFITIIGVTQGSLAIICIGFALSFVGYWGVVIVLRLLSLEIVSTDKRGTAGGMRALINAIGTTLGLLFSSLLFVGVGYETTFIILVLPMVILFFINLKYIKETKGVDLSEI
ncbi:MAG: MFS transporter [Promethearchaeota archaeon]